MNCFRRATLELVLACTMLLGRTGGAVAQGEPAARAATGDELVEVFISKGGHRRPPDAPAAILAPSAGFDPTRPYSLVLYFHGWNGCTRVLTHREPVPCADGMPAEEGWGLAAAHHTVPSNGLFVAVQLAWHKRDGSPGGFRHPEAWAALLGAISNAKVGGFRLGKLHPSHVVLVAHSAGFETALAALDGNLPLRADDVVLFDSMYAGADAFTRWLRASPSHRLVSVHTGRGGPEAQTRLVERTMRRREGPSAVEKVGIDEALRVGPRLTVLKTEVKHRDIPRALLGPVLTQLLRRDP